MGLLTFIQFLLSGAARHFYDERNAEQRETRQVIPTLLFALRYFYLRRVNRPTAHPPLLEGLNALAWSP